MPICQAVGATHFPLRLLYSASGPTLDRLGLRLSRTTLSRSGDRVFFFMRRLRCGVFRGRIRSAGVLCLRMKDGLRLLGADEGFVGVCSVPCPAKWATKRPFGGPRRQSGESRSPPDRRIGIRRLSPAGEAAIRRLRRADPPASASAWGGLRAPRPRPAPSSRTTPNPPAPSSSLVPG